MLDQLKKRFLNRQFLTFGLIGAFNTVLAQVLYILFVKAHVHVSLASVLGDVLSMASSYVLNMTFTYRRKMTWKSAAAFPLSYVPGTLIAAAAVWFVTAVLNAPEIWAKLISLPVTIPLNFIVMSLIVRKTAPGKEE